MNQDLSRSSSVTFRCSAELLAELDSRAARAGMSRSEYLRAQLALSLGKLDISVAGGQSEEKK